MDAQVQHVLEPVTRLGYPVITSADGSLATLSTHHPAFISPDGALLREDLTNRVEHANTYAYSWS